MIKRMKYLAPLIVLVILFGCFSKTSVKTFIVGKAPEREKTIRELINKEEFSDIFSPEVINTSDAEMIMFGITANRNGYPKFLIRAIGRNYNVGRILVGLKTGKILGDFVSDAYKELDRAIEIVKRTKKEVVFWDKHGQAIIIRPHWHGGFGCIKIAKNLWSGGKLFDHDLQKYCEEKKDKTPYKKYRR